MEANILYVYLNNMCCCGAGIIYDLILVEM